MRHNCSKVGFVGQQLGAGSIIAVQGLRVFCSVVRCPHALCAPSQFGPTHSEATVKASALDNMFGDERSNRSGLDVLHVRELSRSSERGVSSGSTTVSPFRPGFAARNPNGACVHCAPERADLNALTVGSRPQRRDDERSDRSLVKKTQA